MEDTAPARTEIRTLAVAVRVFGFEASRGELAAIYRPRPVRIARAAAALAACWLAIPIVFFIPPHAEWVLLAFGGGLYLFGKYWRGEYELQRIEAPCPACATPLRLRAGSTIRFPHGTACFACHLEPWIEPLEVLSASALPGRAAAEQRRGRRSSGSYEPPAASGETPQDGSAAPPPYRAAPRSGHWSPGGSHWR
jgi:hypothetical protein